jgi:hypothetical protein
MCLWESTLFLVVQGFEVRASQLARQVLYHLSPLHQPFFVMGIFKIDLFNYSSGLALNHNPTDLYLLSS